LFLNNGCVIQFSFSPTKYAFFRSCLFFFHSSFMHDSFHWPVVWWYYFCSIHLCPSRVPPVATAAEPPPSPPHQNCSALTTELQCGHSICNRHEYFYCFQQDYILLEMNLKMYIGLESGATQRTTWRHIPEDDTLHNHRCENLKS
jgi:hypothetical protein